MASSADRESLKNGNSQYEAAFNEGMAKVQRDKTSFRANNVARSADPFASGRLPIEEDRY